MRVLQVHNFYTQPGGEKMVLNQEKKLLERNGGTVYQFTKDSKSIKSISNRLYTLYNLKFSNSIFSEFKICCKINNPDIIHVHNTFPLITPAIFFVANELNIPIVYTLHNYRLLYPNGLLLHKGKVDERTIKGSAYKTIPQKVYRDSYVQTAALAYLIEYHRKRKTWEKYVDQFIALTEFAKNKFIEADIPQNRISVKPNFVIDPFDEYLNLKRSTEPEGFIFIGRISEEKGIKNLITVWLENDLSIPLYILGDGPLKKDLIAKTKGNDNIVWKGNVDKREVYESLSGCKALLFPSICYEGFPLTIAEAMAIGVPVMCSNIGSQQSIIKDGITGLHYNVQDAKDLLNKIRVLDSNEELVNKLGENSRKEYLEFYTPEKNYDMLIKIYQDVL